MKNRIQIIYDLANTVTITDCLHYINITISEEDLKKNQTLLSFLELLKIKIETCILTVDDLIQQKEER